mmetsp:Transcript_2016/g.2588  ORF Transcript_2016/g.2588 Transcript_2016/m.2588 type:complete len:173 (+) Transcript_2016:30-548(+)
MEGNSAEIEALPASEAKDNFKREGFEKNRTIFGKILQGKARAKILYEDDKVLCFKDIFPASENHFLVIPKDHIRHFGKLTPDDLPLLRHMVQVAGEVAQENGIANVEEARKNGELSLGFHRFPAITVYHLHLHVIFPMPANSFWQRLKFPTGNGYFYPTPETVAKTYCNGEL